MAFGIDALWYQGRYPLLRGLLTPLARLFQLISSLRRACYQQGLAEVYQASCPVIIVGNISVGGTGKTPLVVWLVDYLRQAGFKPGVISRGYGGKADYWPQLVGADSDAAVVGDEALLIAQRVACPVAVGPVRADSVRYLLQHHACTVIISDDGLQHYALARTIEIAVVDGYRRFGNGLCLPAGPLREPPERLQQVDFVVCNGEHPQANEYVMAIQGGMAVNLLTDEQRSLRQFRGQSLLALAGIGNPDRFFRHLLSFGLQFERRILADHHNFIAEDIDYKGDASILMTEKDAVKCRTFADARHWYVPVQAEIDLGPPLLKLLENQCDK